MPQGDKCSIIECWEDKFGLIATSGKNAKTGFLPQLLTGVTISPVLSSTLDALKRKGFEIINTF